MNSNSGVTHLRHVHIPCLGAVFLTRPRSQFCKDAHIHTPSSSFPSVQIKILRRSYVICYYTCAVLLYFLLAAAAVQCVFRQPIGRAPRGFCIYKLLMHVNAQALAASLIMPNIKFSTSLKPTRSFLYNQVTGTNDVNLLRNTFQERLSVSP
jgi:hypothetical protein